MSLRGMNFGKGVIKSHKSEFQPVLITRCHTLQVLNKFERLSARAIAQCFNYACGLAKFFSFFFCLRCL